MIQVGGEMRVSGGIKLLGEVWKFPSANEVPGLFGVRLVDDHVAVDFGLLHVFGTDMGSWPFLPWVDFVVNWQVTSCQPMGCRTFRVDWARVGAGSE